MKKLFYILLLCSISHIIKAQEKQNNQIVLSGAVDSNDAWELKFSYVKKLKEWFGLGIGLNVYKQYYGGITVSGPPIHGVGINEWILSDNSRCAGGVQLNPFIHINTPTLFHIQDFKADIYMEPGVQMTITSNKLEADYWYNNGYYLSRTFEGHGGKWFSWNYCMGVELENEECLFGLGYFISNMDIYSYKRDIKIDKIRIGDYLPSPQKKWGLCICIGLKF